jgi:hypothetical protein
LSHPCELQPAPWSAQTHPPPLRRQQSHCSRGPQCSKCCTGGTQSDSEQSQTVGYWAKAGVLTLVKMGADQATTVPAPKRLSNLRREIELLSSRSMGDSRPEACPGETSMAWCDRRISFTFQPGRVAESRGAPGELRVSSVQRNFPSIKIVSAARTDQTHLPASVMRSACRPKRFAHRSVRTTRESRRASLSRGRCGGRGTGR